MPESLRIALVLNPIKNQADEAVAAVRRHVAEQGLAEPLILETTEEDPGLGMAREALAQNATLVIAAGGDGTVRAVAEALLHHPTAQLAILPLGTGNLLARNLGLDVTDFDVALKAALQGPVEPLDAQRIDVVLKDRSEASHVGLVATGLGMDAEVMSETNSTLKKFVGPAAYFATALSKVLGWQRHPVRLSVDGGAWDTEYVRTIMLANAGYIQGGIQYAPDVRLDDGQQQAVLLTPRSLSGWVLVAAKTVLRLRKDVPVISYRRGLSITVRPFFPLAAQVDGDPIGEVTTLTSTVLPHALRVRVPQEFDRLSPGGPLGSKLPMDQIAGLPAVAEARKAGAQLSRQWRRKRKIK